MTRELNNMCKINPYNDFPSYGLYFPLLSPSKLILHLVLNDLKKNLLYKSKQFFPLINNFKYSLHKIFWLVQEK